MEQIRDIIHTVVESWDEERQKGCLDLGTLLQGVLTKQELRHARAVSIRQGILRIHADSSSWLYHLSLQKDDLLTKLRSKSAKIQGIRLYLGEFHAKEKNKTG